MRKGAKGQDKGKEASKAAFILVPSTTTAISI